MSTLTPPTPAPAPPPPEAIPEHDKLGPLTVPPAATTALAADFAGRARVVAAIRDAVETARSATAGVDADPATSVHELRKSIRRIRALVELVAAALPRAERRSIRNALRDARRVLGPARDLTVASASLLSIANDCDAGSVAAAIVDAAHADAASAATVADDVRRSSEVALTQADFLAAALPDEIGLGTLVRGLAVTYGRARRARRKARRSERAIHRWRRRCKELGYQLSVLGDLPVATTLRQQLSGLDDQLSGIVDRLLLTDFVGLYGHAGDPLAAAKLLTVVHDQLIAQRDVARKNSRELFSTRPRKLRRRLKRSLAAASTGANLPGT